MSLQSILLLTATSLNVFIALIVLFKNPKSILHITFAGLVFSLSLWALSIFLFRELYSPFQRLFWWRMAFVATSLVPPFLNYFVLQFPIPLLKVRKRTILFLFSGGIFFSLASFSDVIAKSVTLIDGQYINTYGVLQKAFAIYFLTNIVIYIVILIWKYINIPQINFKKQLLLILMGTGISLGIGIFANLILPLLGFQGLNRIGPSGTLVLVSFIAYAILRHKFLDIEIIIKRSFIYSLMVAIITAVYVCLVSIFGGILKGVFGQGHLTTAIASGVFIAFGFFPLRNFLANATDKYFFQKSYNYRKTLQELSKTLSNEIDLNKIMKLLMEAFSDTIKVKSAEIVMLNWNTGEYICRKCADNKAHKLGECVMSDQSALIKLLSSCQSIIPLEDLDSIVKSCFIKHKRKNKVSAADLPKMLEIIRQECNALDAQLIVPMFHRGQLSGFFVLGEKLSEDAFSATDKEMLEIIAYHAGTVIENARLYEKEKLRVKELTLLYNVGWGINSSILTDSFYNNILTIVRDAIGCDRAFLAIVNNDSLLQYVAVDNKDVTLDDIQHITKKVDEGVYEKIFASGTPLVLPSSEYRQLKLSHEEQALFKFGREIILVPLMFKTKTIGFLSVDNNHSRKTLSRLNLNLIMSVASQMALAIENINLNNVALESQKIAAESERMAALGTMTAGLAHEIRNPMVALKTFTDLFPERVNDPEYQRKYIEIVPPEVKRVNDLVSEMLALSRTQKLMLIPTSLSDVIRSVANLIEPELQAQNVSFIFSPPEELIIQASTDQLKQVFLNLFRNAVEAMPKGGSLAVSFQKFKKINKVEITVSDTGIGIEKEKIAHVFEPFYTTRHEGTGLGLAITHKIVEDHSGQIAVDSVQYQGTTFTIKLPISQE